MRKTKTQKGITLVVLVITVIVLIILAAVAIGSIQNHGIIEKAKEAREKYDKGEEKENNVLEGFLSSLDELNEPVLLKVNTDYHRHYILKARVDVNEEKIGTFQNLKYNYYLKFSDETDYPSYPFHSGSDYEYVFSVEDYLPGYRYSGPVGGNYIVPSEYENYVNIVNNYIYVQTPNYNDRYYFDIKVIVQDETGKDLGSSEVKNIYASRRTYCFVAGTLISTNMGLKNIEDLKVGDIVLTYNLENNVIEENKILHTLKSENNVLVDITLENGENLKNTEFHPYFVEGKGWIVAKDLQVGDTLITQEKEKIKISSIEIKTLKEPVAVYNIETDGNHNYFVGKSKILVHNKQCVFPDSQIMSSLEGDYILAENMKEGDNIVYYNFETKQKELGKVLKAYIHKDATDFVSYELEDGTILKATDYHPIYTKEGWKSYTQHNGYAKPKIGDQVQTKEGWKKIINIVEWSGIEDCYDFMIETANGERINNYYANGILVQGVY